MRRAAAAVAADEAKERMSASFNPDRMDRMVLASHRLLSMKLVLVPVAVSWPGVQVAMSLGHVAVQSGCPRKGAHGVCWVWTSMRRWADPERAMMASWLWQNRDSKIPV